MGRADQKREGGVGSGVGAEGGWAVSGDAEMLRRATSAFEISHPIVQVIGNGVDPKIDELAQKLADANATLQKLSDESQEARLAFKQAREHAQICGNNLQAALRMLVQSKIARLINPPQSPPQDAPQPPVDARTGCDGGADGKGAQAPIVGGGGSEVY